MRIPVDLAFSSLGLVGALLLAPPVAAQSKSGALPLPSPARADTVVLWERITLDGEHLQEVQVRITSFDGKTFEGGGRRFAASLAGGSAFDMHARPVALEKALAEHPEGLCALVQYVPARLSALGADTVTGVVLLVDERGALSPRCPDEETRR